MSLLSVKSVLPITFGCGSAALCLSAPFCGHPRNPQSRNLRVQPSPTQSNRFPISDLWAQVSRLSAPHIVEFHRTMHNPWWFASAADITAGHANRQGAAQTRARPLRPLVLPCPPNPSIRNPAIRQSAIRPQPYNPVAPSQTQFDRVAPLKPFAFILYPFHQPPGAMPMNILQIPLQILARTKPPATMPRMSPNACFQFVRRNNLNLILPGAVLGAVLLMALQNNRAAAQTPVAASPRERLSSIWTRGSPR